MTNSLSDVIHNCASVARQFALVLALLLGQQALGQQKAKIEIGRIDTLSSKMLQEKRELWIYTPPAAAEEGYAPKRYPVLYLLDADWNFQSLSGMVHYMSTIMGSVNAQALCPEMIIVGIPSSFRTRTRDLTPTQSTKRWDGKLDKTLAGSGGGEKFMAYIEKEVFPYVEANFLTQPYRLFVGHSLGGLTVVNTLATKPTLFNAYVAIEPSLWWDDKLALKRLESALRQNQIQNRKLFLAVANGMPAGMDTAQARRDTASATLHTRANLELVDLLRRQPASAVAWQWKYYPEEGHASVVLSAEHDALRGFFRHAPLSLPNNVAAAEFNLEAIQRHYASVSEQYGYAVLPPEETINWYAWACKQKQLWAKAEAFFLFNAAHYPQSFNANSGLATFYEERGNKRKALHYYSRALAIYDEPETRQKVAQLRKR
ncbi:alpha/beta hydrolase-fold protein [Hymenobacter latericus]|uniref:alpha/beta hydrolase-fold protein n=1 Tax=Hymenobacter sp. YIM 151858-1 TaxID=2987688 RepID=UPI002226BFAF|nr:alpha/beta hydrolase-fold protein [Hymenobacter sp. YIM 151858-1]UYZ59160.1 alpha/beta hydrolase-fold protein [Hymenobacter sp. YIM 151858-1]